MRVSVCFVLFLIASQLSAQQFDTTVYERQWTGFTSYKHIQNMDFERVSEDSSMRSPHRINPHKKNDIAWLDQGFILSPALNLEYKVPETGYFTMSPALFTGSFMSSESVKFHNSKVPRTHFKYTQGTANLIVLQAEHSQNIFDRWLIGLNYQRIKTQNQFYDNLPDFNLQRMANAHSAQLFTHYATLNKKYEVLAHYNWNKNRIQETGGLQSPKNFELQTGRARLYAGSGFLTQGLNQVAERGIHIEQYFRPGNRFIQVNDSVKVVDSTYRKIKSQWFHTLDVTSRENLFEDKIPNLSLYPNRYLSVITNDSIYNRNVMNAFGRTGKIAILPFRYSTRFVVEQCKVKQFGGHSGNYSNVQWHADVRGDVGFATFEFKSELALIGYYAGDWNYKAEVSGFMFDSSYAYSAGINSIRHRPDYNHQFFGSNYYYWNRPMDKTDYQVLSGGISNANKSFGMQAHYRIISNLSYVDTAGIPQQFSGDIQNISVKAYGTFEMGKHIRTEQNLLFQTSSEDVLRLPNLAYKASLYVEGRLFHKNMLAQFGVDGFFMSRFKAYAYDPASRLFKLSEQSAGGFPMLDVFVNMHVKTMQLYVVYEHATQGNFANDAFSLPNYPLMGNAVRFGAVWRLFD